MKVLELFAGIGAPRAALTKLGINAKYTPIENDKKVVNVYNNIWKTQHTPTDIRDFNPEENYDLVIAGFPCQPFSMAGKRQGFHDDKGRGDLFAEALRIIKKTNPKYVILENVKGLMQKKHIWIIEEIKQQLADMGYLVNVDLLNSKSFGSIQARERVYIYGTKEHLPPHADKYAFSLSVKNLSDYLEKDVDKKLYYDNEKLQKIINWKSQEKPMEKIATTTTTTKTITTRTQPGTASQQVVADNVGGAEKINILQYKNYYYIPRASDGKLCSGAFNRIWSNPKHIGTITSSGTLKIDELMEKRLRIPGLFSKTFNSENYITGENSQSFGTLTASGANSYQRILLKDLKIRSLTPRESYRLMGFADYLFNRVKHLPKTHLYFTAGNSMEVNTVEAVLKSILSI